MIPQQAENWCWAAAIQHVLGKCNLEVSQGTIVKRLSGYIDKSVDGNAAAIVTILNSFGFPASMSATFDSQTMKSLLGRGHYLIIGAQFSHYDTTYHARVIEGFNDFSSKFEVVDPSNGRMTRYSAELLHSSLMWQESIVVEPFSQRYLNSLPVAELYDDKFESLYYKSYCQFYACDLVSDDVRVVLDYFQAVSPFEFKTILTYSRQLALFAARNSHNINAQDHRIQLEKVIKNHIEYHYERHVNLLTPPLTPFQQRLLSSKAKLNQFLNNSEVYRHIESHFIN